MLKRLNQDLLDLRKCWYASIKIHKWEIVQTLALSQPEVIPDDVWQEDYDDGDDNDYGHDNHPEVIVECILDDVGHLPIGPPFAHLWWWQW